MDAILVEVDNGEGVGVVTTGLDVEMGAGEGDGEGRGIPPTFRGTFPAPVPIPVLPWTGRNSNEGICPAADGGGGGGLVGLPGDVRNEGGSGRDDLRGAGVMGGCWCGVADGSLEAVFAALEDEGGTGDAPLARCENGVKPSWDEGVVGRRVNGPLRAELDEDDSGMEDDDDDDDAKPKEEPTRIDDMEEMGDAALARARMGDAERDSRDEAADGADDDDGGILLVKLVVLVV